MQPDRGTGSNLRPGGRLNIKMSSYQYRDLFNMGIFIPGKDGLDIETGPR